MITNKKELTSTERSLKNKDVIQRRNKLRYFLVMLCYLLLAVNVRNIKFKEKEYDFVYREIKNSYLETLYAAEVNVSVPILTTYFSFETMDNGYDIFYPNGSGYRYGPSIITYEDGSADAWFASPGNSRNEWDYIRYRHMSSNGSWSKEEIVLKPTPNSLDHYSVCDPGVIYFNDYYYLGYTSTTDSRNGGINNQIFVARSKNPNGPFEKWNGESWGGKPYPIIEFTPQDDSWGAGEISFAIKGDWLYCYYTWDDLDGNTTRVSKAQLVDDWPSTLQYKGISMWKLPGQDSCDVVYMEDIDRFVAVASVDRMSQNSGVGVFISENGYSFSTAYIVKNNIKSFIHNIGISKSTSGHGSLLDTFTLGYAYSPSYSKSWGKWATRFQEIKFDYFNEKLEVLE